MHLGLEDLAGFYLQHRDGDALVLAIVVATEGSTYRKPGAMMLIAASGEYRGLISGGCLESDLVQQARKVFADGQSRRVSYDLQDDDELVWGLGLGCGGAVHLLLQRLDRDSDFAMLDTIFDGLEAGTRCWLAMATNEPPPGGRPFWAVTGPAGGAGDPDLAEWLAGQQGVSPDGPRFSTTRCRSRGGEADVLIVRIEPAPALLICGAGPDAVPMARLAADLGWRCAIADHRPAFARAERFPASCTVIQTRPEQLSEALDLAGFSAAIVMTHHVEHDAAYLAQLMRHEPAYLGVLGPEARRRRLEEQLEMAPGQVRGPAGLDIGAELPASIALSVLAEIHAALNGRTGGPLTRHA